MELKQLKKHAVTERSFECQRGSLTVRGTEYLPEGENHPVIICSHGFMSCQDRVRSYTQFLAELGYAAYCFDFCGGSAGGLGKSDGLTTDMSVLTEVSDLEAVIRYVRSLPYNSDEVLLMGNSQGGFVSALAAAKPENRVSKLVLFYPALCIPDDARAGEMRFARFDPQNIPEEIECGPMKLGRCYPADVMHMDVNEEIKPYEGPVLIVHGTDDSIVHVDYAKRAYEAYGASDRVKLEIIQGGGHGFAEEHDVIARKVLAEFVKR